MGDELELVLSDKTLADIKHSLTCSHQIQVELDTMESQLRTLAEAVIKSHNNWRVGNRSDS